MFTQRGSFDLTVVHSGGQECLGSHCHAVCPWTSFPLSLVPQSLNWEDTAPALSVLIVRGGGGSFGGGAGRAQGSATVLLPEHTGVVRGEPTFLMVPIDVPKSVRLPLGKMEGYGVSFQTLVIFSFCHCKP